MPSEGEVEPALTFDLLGREFDLPGEENKQGMRMVLGAVKGLSPAFGHLPELCSLLRAVAMPVLCPCRARAVPIPVPCPCHAQECSHLHHRTKIPMESTASSGAAGTGRRLRPRQGRTDVIWRLDPEFK